MRRRTLLTALGAATVPLAGCTTGTDPVGADGGTPADTDTPDADGGAPTSTASDGTAERTDAPEDCPASQELGVERPEDLDASTVEAFVEEHERVYHRDVVIEYEPESSLDSYELSGSVTGSPRPVGDGWELEYAGSGGIYRPTLLLGATTADPPDGADTVPVSEVDDDRLAGTLREAAETGEAELHVDTPGEEVDRYVELLASLSDDFGRLSGRGDSDTPYVDVDGTTVGLTATATSFHGDYEWSAWYYVDERVVRRTTDEETDPRDGKLLECRSPG
ncbi:hypothetical protein BRC62_02510 [Halobacteriales archaeon QH_10_67_13]|nr:MAG: hypothetical protein BRC62_02510 [Halobacteriales archaeon QH_10_67_13]